METDNFDIDLFHEVIVGFANNWVEMLRKSQEELAFKITEYDEEIKSLCEELDWLKQIRVSKLDSGENLKKLKRKRLYGLVLLVASGLGTFATPIFSLDFAKTIPGTSFMIASAICCICCLSGQLDLQFSINAARRIDACSLEEIDEKIRGLEESLQYKRNDRDYFEKVFKFIDQELGVIDQAIASREFDGQMSTLQNSMGAEDDLEQRDIRQDGLDQEDTKGNGLRRVRTNEKSITS